MKFFIYLLIFCLGSGWGQPSSVAEVSSNSYEKVLSFIEFRYVDSDALSEEALNEAILLGLGQKLGPGLQIASESLTSENQKFSTSIKSDVLLDQYLFIRVCALKSVVHIEEVRSLLEKSIFHEGVKGIVLDLRNFRDFLNFDRAAEFLSFFVPENVQLFSLADSKNLSKTFTSTGDSMSTKLPIVVVINRNTEGVAEVIAECLREQNRAVIVGSNSGGRAVYYDEMKWSNDRFLRVASQRVLKASGVPLFPGSVEPDLKVLMSPKEETKLLEKELTQSLAPFVLDQERLNRQNEAALVRGESSKINFLREKLKQHRGDEEEKIEKDVVLQRAFDVVRTIDTLNIEERMATSQSAKNILKKNKEKMGVHKNKSPQN